MSRVLLIEDSSTSQLIVAGALSGSEIALDWVKTVSEAKRYLEHIQAVVDLIILDLILPDGDGISLLGQIRSDQRFRTTPVLLLTGKEDISSKLSAFSLGADDYLTKPINPLELRARIDMHLRKVAQNRREQDVLRRGGLSINVPLMRVFVGEGAEQTTIELTAKEFRILTFLAKHEGVVYSRTDLIKHVWGDSTHVVKRTVDSHVCGLRKKLGPFASYIENVTGSGYRFVVSNTIETTTAPAQVSSQASSH